MQDNREKLNILIWKDHNGEFVFLDEAFKHSDWFMWLVGTIMAFHTQDEWENELDNYIDCDWLLDLWKEWVYHWNITQSYDDWCDAVRDEDWISVLYDTGYNYKSRLEEWCEIAAERDWIDYDSEYSDCRGGGRCFDRKMLEDSYREWTVEGNFKKFKSLYIRYELPNDEKNDIADAKKRLKELVLAWYFTAEQVDDYLVKIKVPRDAKKFLDENKEKISKREAENLVKKIDEDDTND